MTSLLSIGMFACLNGSAQKMPADRDLAAFSWEVSFPASNKYINTTSLSGWRFEYRKGIKNNLSVGIAMSWSAFDEYVNTETYSSPGKTRAITTDMIRQVYTLPITLNAHHYFSTKSKLFETYVGLNLGAQYAEHKAFLNIYELEETNWGFTARPEIGTLLRFSSHSPVKGLVAVGYNYSTNKNKAFDIDNWNHITLNVGIAIGTAQ